MNVNKYNIVLILLCICFSCKKASKKNTGSRVDTLPYFEDASFTPKWLRPNSTQLENFHKIPNFELTNQDGEKVTQKTVEGKIYITDFFFTTCPGICPKMTSNMYLVQEAFKDDTAVLILSHSVTPAIDSVSILKEYATENEIITNKWHLLTGDRKQIYNLGRKAYFVEEDLGKESVEDDFLHTENFVLIDNKRHVRGVYNGLNKASITQLILDVKTLKREL